MDRRREARELKEQERKEAAEERQLAEREAEHQRQLAIRAKEEHREKVVAILEAGKLPDVGLNIDLPFKLQRNEVWLFAMGDVPYSEVRTQRRIEGRSTGTSIRVAKGVSVRAGASRGTPVERDVLTDRGAGIFALSTKHVYFNGERSFRIPMGKIVSAQIVNGGLELVRDRASAQPEYFGLKQDDAAFVVDLIHLLPSVDFGRGQAEILDVSDYVMLMDSDALFHEE